MPNVYSTTDPTQPGYFRIGFVVLQIPPTDIACNKVVNDDQISTLRGQSPMFIKSGQARWDVTIRWKALRFINHDGSYDYTQWEDLQSIAAIFKVAPFVEVDNQFLRQHFTNIQQAYQTQRMAFALKQLRVDTNPDSVNVLDITLTMSLFNYAPYSTDFAYVSNTNGGNVGADQSDVFQDFISGWIASNFDSKPASFSSPPIKNWNEQSEGTVNLKWRTYNYVPFQSPQPQPVSNASAGYTPQVPPPTVPPGASSVVLPNSVQSIINSVAPQYGLDPTIISAQCQYESHGQVNAKSSTGAIGLLQVLPSTAGPGVDLYDPTQNITAGCKYMQLMLQKPYIGKNNYFGALGAYNAGPGYVYAYSKGVAVPLANGQVINPQKVKTANGLPPAGIPHYENATLYATTILTTAGKANLIPPVTVQPVNNSVPPPPTSTTPLDTPNQGLVSAVNAAVTQMNQTGAQWYLDHYTEFGALFYQENVIRLASVDSTSPSDYSMFPHQISIVLVNNLPVIPLAAMQYPTFQHVGPCDTMVSIGFNSVGDVDSDLNEPEHEGIEALAAMSSQLEDQFHALRTVFRAVSSIHRTQAVFIENQVLNLLGIQGTMIRGLNTETVPEAVGLAQVSLMASQYDNIFEETAPYSMNGVSSAYSAALKTLMTSGQLSNLTPQEKAAYSQVQAFSTAWTALDPKFLLQQILSISEKSQDFLSDVSNTPTLSLNGSQKNDVLNALDQDTNSDQNTGDFTGLSAVTGNSVNTQAMVYPGLQIRRLAIQKSSAQLSYADFFVFSQLPLQANQTEITTLTQQLNAQYSSQMSTILGNMYSRLWDWEVLTNPELGREASVITRSPTFQNQFSGAISVTGPSADPANKGHFCYKDLGLTAYNQTPASYMVDYNGTANTLTTNEITQALGTANQAANQANAPQTVTNPAGTPVQPGYTFVANGQGIQSIGSGSAVSRMYNLPAYSMNSAYPTFKLFLMEENNTGPFFGFDNFYSYASVMDIEVIKYQDKPDTAIIQITNLAHLLQHRMYDDTAAGKLEAKDDRFNDQSTFTSTGEAGTGGNPNAAIIAGKTIAGVPYQRAPRKNMSEGIGETYSRIPLKFFALQTGSKIQVRLGFTNNPDSLYPVFTGQVTEIEGDDILRITCQSFQLELMNVPGTTVKKNTRLGFNFISGGAAFGGYSIMNSGDTINVMKTMLTSPASRHFGRWQIGQQVDPLLKGFEWSEVVGSAMESASNQTISTVGALLQSGYDRSGENILVNFTVNFDATNPTVSTAYNRTWYNENPNWFLGSARYSIPKQSKLSIWDILKDISRRYPEYNLMVRDYGFPYQADATLVYGHPLDWYYTRPPLYGEAEVEQANNSTQGQLFAQWWSTTGAAAWHNIFTQAINIQISVSGFLTAATQTPIRTAMAALEGSTTTQAGSGPEGFYDATQTMVSFLQGNTSNLGTVGAPGIPSGIPTSLLINAAIQVSSFGNIGGGFSATLVNDFTALYRQWLAYLQNSEPAANSSRVRPIRSYHMIDQNHIVHNGITVNDNVYNAVKVGDFAPYKFNQNIPDQHTRVLDVTDLINDPDQNVYPDTFISQSTSVFSHPLANRYAQSFLREEVGKMYQGELILRGVPEIEPFDVILLSDPSTGMVGPIEVESVIHSFNVENGYITIVRPRLLLLANEAVSMGVIQTLVASWANASAEIQNLSSVFNLTGPNATFSGTTVTSGAVAAGLLASAAGFAWAPPVGITLAVLGLLAGTGLLIWGANGASGVNANFFQMMPLSRFGRPWVGGLQGFALSDFAYSLRQSFRRFDAEEIQPLIESWETFMNYQQDYVNFAAPGTGY